MGHFAPPTFSEKLHPWTVHVSAGNMLVKLPPIPTMEAGLLMLEGSVWLSSNSVGREKWGKMSLRGRVDISAGIRRWCRW